MRLYPLVHTWWDDRTYVIRDCLLPKPVELFILRFPTEKEREDRKDKTLVYYMSCEPRVYKHTYIRHEGQEPEIIQPEDYPEFIKNNYNKVDYVFDFDQEVVGHIPNCIHTLSAYSFIPKKLSQSFKAMPKKFGVSFVCTNKTDSHNQILRQVIWHDQDRIKTPKFFFNSSRRPMREDFGLPKIRKRENGKMDLFACMFSIAIENCVEHDYFTEKLIDCFATKTVPIYLGCPNIGEFFDTDGIIFAEDEEDIINTCNMLNEGMYHDRIAAINRNYVLAQPYLSTLSERATECVKRQLFPDWSFDAF